MVCRAAVIASSTFMSTTSACGIYTGVGAGVVVVLCLVVWLVVFCFLLFGRVGGSSGLRFEGRSGDVSR